MVALMVVDGAEKECRGQVLAPVRRERMPCTELQHGVLRPKYDTSLVFLLI